MIRTLGTVFAGLLGLAFGSFLNVCLSRWPRRMSVVKPRSYCESCGRTLAWWENVPLLSWLALRGRCRTCRAWIGWRTVLVELAVGTVWAIIAWRYFSQFTFAAPDRAATQALPLLSTIALLALDWVLIFIAVLDAEHLWIPDVVTYPGIAMGVLFPILFGGMIGLPFVRMHFPWNVIVAKLFAALISAGLILLIRWLYWLIRRREGLGLGDAKLMAMLAAWLGFSGAMLSFGIGVVLGAVVALLLLAVRKTRGQAETWALTKLPLGTFLCIGGIISSLWGSQIIDAYMRWAGF